MKRLTDSEMRYAKRLAIEEWFRSEYVIRQSRLAVYQYFGLTHLQDDSEYQIMKDAYEKEQTLRKLLGKEALPPVTDNSLF